MLAATFRAPRLRVLVVLVSAVLAWASIATVASAVADKTFSATVGPDPLVAGASYSVFPRPAVVLVLTNTSTQAQLGSANVTVAAGLTATSVSASTGDAGLNGSVIELRNLDLPPGGHVNVLVSTQVECDADNVTYPWLFQVKQANDFNGTPGNDLAGTNPTSTGTGHCQLSFSGQPADSENAPAVITSKIYDETGPPVSVTITDADGTLPVGWWTGSVSLAIGDAPAGGVLDGTTSSSVTNGVATFAPTISVSGTGYSLVATAAPTADTPSVGTSTAGLESDNFNIVDDADVCQSPGAGCHASANGPKTVVDVTASAGGATGDLVILSLNDPSVSVQCGTYVASSDVILYNVTDSTGSGSSNRSKSATLKLLAQFVTKSASKYQVCYDDGSGPELLESCSNKVAPPCVASKALDKFKNLVIVVSSPAGDPRLTF